MIHLTLAVGDFMLILLDAALWIGGGIVAAGLLGLGVIGGVAVAVRRWWRRAGR